MCKPVAAVLYGVGVRLDAHPELLFKLRGVNHEELIEVGDSADALVEGSGSKRDGRRRLSAGDVSDVFGVELEDEDA